MFHKCYKSHRGNFISTVFTRSKNLGHMAFRDFFPNIKLYFKYGKILEVCPGMNTGPFWGVSLGNRESLFQSSAQEIIKPSSSHFLSLDQVYLEILVKMKIQLRNNEESKGPGFFPNGNILNLDYLDLVMS